MRLLVVKEKDDTRYFLISCLADLGSIALKILTQRKRSGWYGTVKEYKKYYANACVDLAQLKKLKLSDCNHKKQLIRAAEQEVEICQKQLTFLQWAQQAIKAKSGAQAYDLLMRRSADHFEYETLKLRDFESY